MNIRISSSFRVVLIILIALWIGLIGFKGRPPASARMVFATITVTTTADAVAADGQCSLREAIQAANTNAAVNECSAGAAGQDTIGFNLGANPNPVIALTSPLPDIVEPVIIFGNSGGATRVTLNGDSAGANSYGLRVTTNGTPIENTVVSSLVIRDFDGDGIQLTGNGNTVVNCFIGVGENGAFAAGNSSHGISVSGANNRIGGPAVADRNVISANSVNGISIDGAAATGNVIEGNFIGTNDEGNADLGNLQRGVSVFNGANNTVIRGNVISGNDLYGIDIAFFTNNCQVTGNRIGTDAAGDVALGNGDAAMLINFSSTGHQIGGILPSERNIISANGFATATGGGLAIVNSSSATISGNYIGTNAAGTGALGNNVYGITIGADSANCIIGGTTAGSRNRIAFNSQKGILMDGAGSVSNRVLGNEIFSNGSLGIDLNNDGAVNPNDPGDGDSGANNLQNFPVLASAVLQGSSTSIQGALNSAANTTYRVEFFSNPACDVLGNGEGQVYLGFSNVTTDAGGNAAFSVSLPVSLTFGHVVTATATDPANNTSEFSACGCTYTLTPSAANFSPAGGNGAVAVATGSGCPQPATSNVPWINVTGSGSGTVSYTVAANASTMPRTGSITIAGFSFFVTQQAAGAIVQEDFSGGIPPGWTVVDGGSPGVYLNTGGALTWTTDNPCTQLLVPPFVEKVAMVDAACTIPGLILDEELRPPAFDATGLGSVYVEFFSQFKWSPLAPNNKGEVDVSINGGATWTNVLRLENGNDGVPTPVTKSINISPVISANPSNVLVRLRYTGVTISSQLRPSRPEAQELSWGIDFSIYSFKLSPTSQNFSADGGSGLVNVSASVAVPNPQGEWTASSNVPWITLATQGGTGNGSLGYVVTPNPMTSPRTGTITIAGNTFTVTQAAACPSINVMPATLPNGVVGTAYNQTLTASGGTSPYTFTVSAGALPTGITLSSGGTLTGTPTTQSTSPFTVRATDASGCFGERGFTLHISGNGLQFYPLPSPVRLLDTRSGFTGCTTGTGALAAGSTRTQPARTACSTIPANATAIIGNITVVPSGPGYLTLFPGDATQPTVANSNFKAGEVTNNFFTVGLGASGVDAGAFKIFTSATTDVIIDLTGYYAPPGANGLFYHPLPAPVRLVETRAGQTGCFQPAQLQGLNNPNADPNLDLQVQGRSPGLPSACSAIPSDAVVLVGNATTVFPNAPFGAGYLTIYPSNAARPTVASSNYATNDVINGPFAVKLGADGKFKIYTFSATDLVVDISGYYSASASDANGTGLLFNPLPKPMRLLETRPDFPGFPLTGCYRTNAPIQGSPNVRTQQAWGACPDQPPLTIPPTARALVGNATVLNPVNAGFLTFFPGNVPTAPTVATSNYPFPVVFGYNRHYYVGLNPTDGTFKMLTQFTTDLIVDVSGYFAP